MNTTATPPVIHVVDDEAPFRRSLLFLLESVGWQAVGHESAEAFLAAAPAFPAGGGCLVLDTPGMRELQLWAGREALDETFDEIAELATRCRFGDCSHRVEGGCAVRQALEAGELDPARWENYRKLQGEIRRHELLADHTAAAAEKAKWKAIHKAVRVQYKLRGK